MAVVGKGGAGKSVIAGTMARFLAREGQAVLALDSDLMPGLELSLGAAPPRLPPLEQAVERDDTGRWRLKKGIGPVRAVKRYSTPAPDGVRLLQCGKLGREGLPPILGAVNGFYQVVHRLSQAAGLQGWAMIGDLPAGPRQAAFDWAPYAHRFIVVVEPTLQSLLTARRVARIARSRRGADAFVVANKVEGGDVERIESMLAEPVRAVIPSDSAVAEAERRGEALIDHAPASSAARAIERLAQQLHCVASTRR